MVPIPLVMQDGRVKAAIVYCMLVLAELLQQVGQFALHERNYCTVNVKKLRRNV